MTQMDILITGGSGQVGKQLQLIDWPEGIKVFAPARQDMNLADPQSIDNMMHMRRWAAVINAGAYTAVDKCESDVTEAWKVNALAPAVLARATALAKIPLLHVSTDYVFDGTKPGAYVETDPVGPLGVYGASKEGGEQAVRSANPHHAILRTAWVTSPHGQNFVKTMLRVGRERALLRVVDDQQGCPTSAADIARALAVMVLRMIDTADAPRGTFHFVNSGHVTWHGLAVEIFAQAAQYGGPSPKVEAITTAQYPLPAPRPANSRLSCDKICQAYGFAPRAWQDALRETIADIMK